MLALAVAGLLAGAGSARAQSPEHIGRLATHLQREVRHLHGEVDGHFRNTPQYRHLHNDLSGMECLAAHLHEVMHRGGSPDYVRADVEQLDRLFHHLEGSSMTWSSPGEQSRWVDPRAVGHIRRALDWVGRTVHRLEDEVN